MKMGTRNLLYVELGEEIDTNLLEILSRNWVVHKAHTSLSIQKLIEDERCPVGIVRFGSDCEGLCRPDLKDILFSSPYLKWVAILQRTVLENIKVREVISQNFYDYHLLPVDAELLQMTLGHAHGKARLERQFLESRSRKSNSGCTMGW